MTRILGIDYGAKRIGLALSDPLKITSRPFDVWINNGQEDFFFKLEELIKRENIEIIVIGNPKNMDGTLGFQAKEVQDFFQKFIEYKSEIKFIYWDERLSSKEAEKILHEKGFNEEKMRGQKDAYAASIILRDYLDYGV